MRIGRYRDYWDDDPEPLRGNPRHEGEIPCDDPHAVAAQQRQERAAEREKDEPCRPTDRP